MTRSLLSSTAAFRIGAVVLSRSTFIATLARMALAGEVAGLALRGLHRWRQRVH